MTDNKTEFDKRYRKGGRFKKKDSDRLTLKSVSQARREEQHSDFTTRAMGYVVPGFLEQDKQDKSTAGSKEKRRQGFWLAAIAMVSDDPDIKPKAAWNMLPGSDHDLWQFERDGDKMVRRYHGRDKLLKKSQDWSTLTYSAFRQGYIYKARKEIRTPDK